MVREHGIRAGDSPNEEGIYVQRRTLLFIPIQICAPLSLLLGLILLLTQ